MGDRCTAMGIHCGSPYDCPLLNDVACLLLDGAEPPTMSRLITCLVLALWINNRWLEWRRIKADMAAASCETKRWKKVLVAGCGMWLQRRPFSWRSLRVFYVVCYRWHTDRMEPSSARVRVRMRWRLYRKTEKASEWTQDGYLCNQYQHRSLAEPDWRVFLSSYCTLSKEVTNISRGPHRGLCFIQLTQWPFHCQAKKATFQAERRRFFLFRLQPKQRIEEHLHWVPVAFFALWAANWSGQRTEAAEKLR